MSAKDDASNSYFKIGSDLARVDAHEITPEEYEEIPEVDDDLFQNGEIRHGDKVIRPGRPPLARPKKPVTLRLDQAVLDHFRAGGPGWQTRINEALKRAMTEAA